MEPAAVHIEGITHRFGDAVALDGATLHAAPGELVSILGPSGCGKSTLLQVIAGHVRPDAGSVRIGDSVVLDAGADTHLAPELRDVGMVFQEYALFPHLTVADNVAYGIARTSRLPWARRRGAEVDISDLLERFAIADLAGRFPTELSGGQQQRVALARAVARRPRLLLLDEPFCNLDASTREQVRTEVVELLRSTGITCLFVTHDQEEALAVSDRVAVMQSGRIMQVDDPETLYRRPFCKEVAEFLGRSNLLRGTARGEVVETEIGTWPLDAPTRGEVTVLVRPELIGLRADPEGTAVVTAREFRGHDVVYTLRTDSGLRVTAHRPSVDMASVGERVRIEPQHGTASRHGAVRRAEGQPPLLTGTGATRPDGSPLPVTS